MRPYLQIAVLVVGALVSTATAGSLPNDTGVVRSKQRLPEEGVTESRVYFRIPHIRQEHNLCVPTAAAMVLAHYGDPQPPRKLKVLSRGKAWDPGAPFDDFTITWWSALLRGLGKLGYGWRDHAYPNTDAGFLEALAAVRASLRRGEPVLVDVALYGSHTFVITGYDDETTEVFIADPNLPAPGVRVLTYDQLKGIWNGLSYDADWRPTLFTNGRKKEGAR